MTSSTSAPKYELIRAGATDNIVEAADERKQRRKIQNRLSQRARRLRNREEKAENTKNTEQRPYRVDRWRPEEYEPASTRELQPWSQHVPQGVDILHGPAAARQIINTTHTPNSALPFCSPRSNLSKVITPQIRHSSTSISRGRATAPAHPMRHCGPGLVYIQSRPLVLCVHSPSASFPCDEVERRYFELFREQLAFNFCGYFETLFWTQLVPQECHHEPAIRYAIFALAALCKSSTCNVDTAIVTDEHLNFAFVQYGKAVCSLRQSLAEDSSRVRLALIASVLFGCFESFYGKWQTAAQHVYSGLNILKRLQRTSNDKTCKWQTAAQSLATVEPVISQALGHLNLKLLIISFLAMSPLYDYPFDDSEDQAVEDQAMIQQLPGRFTTLGDAFPSAISLSMSSLLHLRRSGKYTNGEPLQLATAREQESLSTAVDRWLKAFRPILTEASQNLTSRKHLGALQLQICLLTSKISMSTSIYRDEMMFDKFTRQFQYIVSISRHVLEKDQEFRASSGPKTQFSMGLIMSLYYTATRCRDSSVRRDAIAILKELPRRNGVWDSWQAAKAAEWIVSIEEEGCDSNGFIPEEWRVRMTSLNVEMRNGGRVSVECMQGSVDHMLKLRKADLL